MFDFTPQERQVVLFLITTALVGVGINYAAKVNAHIERMVKLDSRIAKIDLNKATDEELTMAPGISKAIAKKIIEYRASKEKLTDLEELKEIKGIGQRRLEKLKELFFLE